MARKKWISSLILVLMVIVLAACNSAEGESSSNNKKITIKVATTSGKDSLIYDAAVLFKEKVEERSNGNMKVTIYDNGQLGKDATVLDALKSGSIEMSIPSSVLTTKAPEFGVFDIPFLFDDRSKVETIANGDIWNKDLKSLLPEHGLVGLGFWENGYRQITNNTRPINTPEDLEGIKLRVPDSAIRVAMFKELGANPTPMDLNEVFTALQQGVVDGQENPLSTTNGVKLQQVQKYLSMTNHVYTPVYLVSSKKWYDKLSKEDQELLTKAADEVGNEIRKKGEDIDEKLIKQFEEEGVKVNTADMEAFKKQTEPIIELFYKEMDKEFVDKVIEAAK
ncbi:TRAP transporter substrate-binding protein [Fictibacillus sp. UD]|uniref:TRAP transporter substrate-binding protein n=1 Tax=Fictibacillus sp. UD TaxID=3038777 RepID=UPI0037459DA6